MIQWFTTGRCIITELSLGNPFLISGLPKHPRGKVSWRCLQGSWHSLMYSYKINKFTVWETSCNQNSAERNQGMWIPSSVEEYIICVTVLKVRSQSEVDHVNPSLEQQWDNDTFKWRALITTVSIGFFLRTENNYTMTVFIICNCRLAWSCFSVV